MPIKKAEDFGTNTDGSQNQDYCQYCYQRGKFTESNTTMQQMIEKVSDIMRQMKIPEAQIEQTKTFIPMLKRWKK